jgi:predicted HicB family RNase H-like nuclease
MAEPETVDLKVQMPVDLHRRIKMFAASKGKSMKQILIEAVRAYCKL